MCCKMLTLFSSGSLSAVMCRTFSKKHESFRPLILGILKLVSAEFLKMYVDYKSRDLQMVSFKVQSSLNLDI